MICGLEWLVLQSRWSVKERCHGENTAGLTLNYSRSFSCTVTFIFKVVTLISFVLAEYESKKMCSKFDNVTPAYGTWWKKFHEENLNYCSVNLFTFFTFKGLRNVKTLKSFFFQRGILCPVKHLIKSFLKKKKHV